MGQVLRYDLLAQLVQLAQPGSRVKELGYHLLAQLVQLAQPGSKVEVLRYHLAYHLVQLAQCTAWQQIEGTQVPSNPRSAGVYPRTPRHRCLGGPIVLHFVLTALLMMYSLYFH